MAIFLFCNSDPKPQLARQITLNYAGRLYTASDRNQDGIHENPAGIALRCDWLSKLGVVDIQNRHIEDDVVAA